MYNAMAVNVTQAIEDLAKQAPGSINIIVQAIPDQIS